VPILVRSFDRGHAIKVLEAGADHEVRETFGSALELGAQTLVTLGVDPEAAAVTIAEVRKRDADRFALQRVGGIIAGRDLMIRTAIAEAVEQQAQR
jgi:voltage-gated potassium channel Kch